MKFEAEVLDEGSEFPVIYDWWFDSDKVDRSRFEGHGKFTVTVKIDGKTVYEKTEVIAK